MSRRSHHLRELQRRVTHCEERMAAARHQGGQAPGPVMAEYAAMRWALKELTRGPGGTSNEELLARLAAEAHPQNGQDVLAISRVLLNEIQEALAAHDRP